MSDSFYSALLIATMSIITILLRILPFLIFSEKRQPPKKILYLEEVLPPAILGMLVIYCLKDISLLTAPHGAYELVSCAVVILVQLWKHQTILSIVSGTGCYMGLLALCQIP